MPSQKYIKTKFGNARNSRLILLTTFRSFICRMEEQLPVHTAFRKTCDACHYHCSVCKNRAQDETKTRFLNYRDLYEGGGCCLYDCEGSELKNQGLCYHCHRPVPIARAFCLNDCFRQSSVGNELVNV